MYLSDRPPTGSALPSHIGRYEVVTQIGAGGMARVYLGVQRGPLASTKLVVIKQLRAEMADDQQATAMFADEARITLRLNHPNVVHTYELGTDSDRYYLVMEFLEGHSLLEVQKRVGRDVLPLNLQIWVLCQVLAALHYAHELQDFDGTPLAVVHRDVSPSNVFLCYSGEVKLLDFGIAKASGALAETQQGILKGKLGYASPEQCRGRPADGRSDVYAVGVMLWEAMAGRRRLSGETGAAVFLARISDAEPSIEEVWPDAPPELVAICKRSLANDPADRYDTALEFQRDLERYLSSVSADVTRESLAALLRSEFRTDYSELRRLIEAHVGASRPPESGPQPSAELESSPRHESLTAPQGPYLDDIATEPAPTDRRWRRHGRVGALLGTLAIVIAALAWVARRQELESKLSSARPQTVVTNTAASMPAARAVPSEVRVRVAAMPRSAVLSIDGRALESNPFRGLWPRDGAEHRLRIQAPGFFAEERTLSFDRDLDLEIALERTPTSVAKNASREKSKTAKPGAEPGMDLQLRSAPRAKLGSGARAKLRIDEADPYGTQ